MKRWAETSFNFNVFTERAESQKTGFSTYDRVDFCLRVIELFHGWNFWAVLLSSQSIDGDSVGVNSPAV